MRRLCQSLAIAFVLVWSGAALAAQDAPVQTPGKGITVPVLIKDVKPQYTPAALSAGIQGDVELSVVVLTDGTAGEVLVTKSLDSKLGLDEEAVKAANQWLFEPGKKDGKAVPVRVTALMTFTLKP